ncbi:protein AIG1, partial [Biomphalaria glabrata]
SAPSIKIALIGKTGHGKSSTGNTILRKHNAFDSCSDTGDGTEILSLQQAIIGKYKFKVYDLPGLQATRYTDQHIIRQLHSLMDSALNINLFIFVFSYMCRFSAEEERAYSDLQKVFGSDFLKKHGMIVVTHGDICAQDAKEKQISVEQAFKNWCDGAGEKFKRLREMVDGRIRLVDNKGSFENDSKRVVSSEEILNIAINMFHYTNPFTKEEYDKLQKWCTIL